MRLLSNCPNCGAPLRSDGYCEYCKTKIRYANHIEILNGWEEIRNNVEILLKIERDNTTILVPFKGRLSQLTMENTSDCFLYADDNPYCIMSHPEVTLTFEGFLSEIPETELKGSQ